MARRKNAEADRLYQVIRRYRSDHELSLKEMGEICGKYHSEGAYTDDTIDGWEKRAGRPSVGDIPIIAEGLEMTVQELITGEKPEQVDACKATGLSSETIETMRKRDILLDWFIRNVIQNLINPEFYEDFMIDLIALYNAQTREYDESEEWMRSYIKAGIRQMMFNRYEHFIEETLNTFVLDKSSKDIAVKYQLGSAFSDFHDIARESKRKKEERRNAKSKR